jgi:hypothetical protein
MSGERRRVTEHGQTEEDTRDLDMWRYGNLRTADKSLDKRMNT